MGSFAEWWETGDIAMPLNLLQTIQKLEKDRLVFSRPLLALLEESQQQRHSSDPRDKIFALIGLASDKESYIRTVDYSIATGTTRANKNCGTKREPWNSARRAFPRESHRHCPYATALG